MEDETDEPKTHEENVVAEEASEEAAVAPSSESATSDVAPAELYVPVAVVKEEATDAPLNAEYTSVEAPPEQPPVTSGHSLTSVLSESTKKRLAWYFEITAGGGVDDFFASLPAPNEAEVLLGFARFTRQIAGDDPDVLDETIDAKRLKLHGGLHNAPRSGVGGSLPARKRKRASVVDEGRHVAAKINEEWILMTVLRYMKKSRTYMLEDADEQVEKKEEVEVTKDMVLPLSCVEYQLGPFSPGFRVLALYPGTTGFYVATVVKCMKRAIKRTQPKQAALFDYLVRYDEDDLDEEGETIIHNIKGEFVTEALDL